MRRRGPRGCGPARWRDVVAERLYKQGTGQAESFHVWASPIVQWKADGRGAERIGPAIHDVMWQAAQIWIKGGGRRGEDRRRKARADASKRIQLAAAQHVIRTFLGQKPSAQTVGLSGRPLEDVGSRFAITIAPRGRRRRRSRGWGAAHATAAGAGRKGSLFQQGLAPNKFFKWRVERVLEVRRATDDNGRQSLEARLRWAGHDPITKLPWADSWHAAVRGATFTKALFDEAKAMESVQFGIQPPASRATVRVAKRGREEAQYANLRVTTRGAATATASREAAAAAARCVARRKRKKADDGEQWRRGERSRRIRELQEASRLPIKRRRRHVIVSDTEASDEEEVGDAAASAFDYYEDQGGVE